MRLCLILLTEGVFRRRLEDGAGCGARAQVSHTWTREASGLRLGVTMNAPPGAGLRADREWSARTRGPERPKIPRWSAGRRAGPVGPAISGESEIGPTARRATR